MLIAQNYPLVAGQKLPNMVISVSGNEEARGVIVDNGNSTTDVWVYEGNNASGTPYVVLAGWVRGFSLSGGSRNVYVTFPDVPSSAGQIGITVSDAPQSAFSTQVATVVVAGPITVAGGTLSSVGSIGALPPITGTVTASVPAGVAVTNTPNVHVPGLLNGFNQISALPATTFPISAAADLPIKTGTSGAIKTDGSAVTQPISAAAPLPVSGSIAVTSAPPVTGSVSVTGTATIAGAVTNQAINDYPIGATPITISGSIVLANGNNPLTTLSAVAAMFYIIQMDFQGLESQKLEWFLRTTAEISQTLRGIGDQSLQWKPPYPFSSLNIGPTVLLGTSDTPIGTTNIYYNLVGYYL